MRPSLAKSIFSLIRQESAAKVSVSLLHFFLETHGLSEKVAFLHTINYTGQNNNNCMVQYLVWRALTKHHTSINHSFLVVSHTKFAPDWCCSLSKHHFHRTKIKSLKGIAQTVNDSALCRVQFHSAVCNKDGSTIVPTYNWSDIFAPQLKKTVGIKKYHHFRCTPPSLDVYM